MPLYKDREESQHTHFNSKRHNSLSEDTQIYTDNKEYLYMWDMFDNTSVNLI
jgi:hypothetical protein